MTRGRDRLHLPGWTDGRPRSRWGRRLAVAFVLALVVASSTASLAAADQPVVSATIYPASSGSVTHPTAMLGTLGGCQGYSGPNPMSMYGSNGAPLGPQSLATYSTWTLAEILKCALQQPLSEITDVQVSRGHSFEDLLSNAELTDPAQYQDPAGTGALPVVSNDGGQDQNTYVRPWRGGTDDNAQDVVVQPGPISIVVYENSPPLKVTATQSPRSKTASTEAFSFSATVTSQDGSPVPASELSWDWNINDGSTPSLEAAPSHTFQAGTYSVTVEVADNSTGLGGTATVTVNALASSGPGGQPPGGGGPKPTGPGTGPTHSGGGPPGRSPGTTPGTGQSGSHNHNAGSPSVNNQPSKPHSKSSGQPTQSQSPTPNTTAPHTNSAASPETTAGPSAKAHGTKTHRGTNTHSAHSSKHVQAPPPNESKPASARPAITGLLISDVRPLPVGASPLVRVVPAQQAAAPAVREAASASTVPVIAASLAIVLLLGLGAGRELRSRRVGRTLRFGD